MKKTRFIWMLLATSLISVSTAGAVQASRTQTGPAGSGPVAVVKEPGFEFEPVIDGTIVSHEFIIENKGDAPLAIEKITTGCGCTTAGYTKIIQPNEQGSVSIKANTSGYGGGKFSKTIRVYTNDPKNSILRLPVGGIVESFAVIQPDRVILRGDAGNRVESSVTIIPSEKYPFAVIGSSTRNLDGKIAYDIEKEGAKYVLKIRNLLNEPGKYYGAIELKTDSTVKPALNLRVYGVINEKKKRLHE